ncbi:MAG: dihydrofolate reductase [Propylenella sp.]
MTRRPIVIVVGVGENGVIGVDGQLPWRVRADLRKFRAITMGKPIVMGRKTFESIGRALDGRDNILVSRQPGYRPPGAVVAPSLEAALTIADERAAARGADEICVVGGGEIYAAAFPLASRLHVTHVAASPKGDTIFPKISSEEWAEVSRERLPPGEGDTASAVHMVYERRREGRSTS